VIQTTFSETDTLTISFKNFTLFFRGISWNSWSAKRFRLHSF